MAITDKRILEQIKSEDEALLTSRVLDTKFGREEDYVEIHLYDAVNNLVTSVQNFENYNFPELIDSNDNLANQIIINPDNAVRNLGFNSGLFNLIINCHRQKITSNFEDAFYISEISPSRTEIRVKLNSDIDELDISVNINQFLIELTEQSYFKDFAINLGSNIVLTGVNFIQENEEDPTFLIKLYEPLPNNITEKTSFRIIEELTNPIQYTVDLGTPSIKVETNELRGPNLRIDTRINSSIPSTYKSYDNILKSESSSSLAQIINAISSSIPVSVEYDNPNNDSETTFKNFIHFSSAEERLRNFQYKLELIELYTTKSAQIEDISNFSSIPSLVNEKLQNESLKTSVIGNFDGFEKFLYFESGTYSWPKSTSTKPYQLYATTASEALTWYGSINEASPNFGGQLLSASNYDSSNPYILRNTIPQYILDNNQNTEFITFIDMVGQFYDNIWLYIDNITDKNIAHNKLNKGISKDLVFNALKERGIPAFDQFENTNLFEYLIAGDRSGSFQYQDIVGPGPTSQSLMISASNEGSITKENIAKEVWKRLYHNAPYLLKTKGTERGIKALIACYGIPETILHVKEYGGPTTDKSKFKTFSYKKFSKALRIFSGSIHSEGGHLVDDDGNILTDDEGNHLHAFIISEENSVTIPSKFFKTDTKTVQFRFTPDTGSEQTIAQISGSLLGGPLNFSINQKAITPADGLLSSSLGTLVISSGSQFIASSSKVPLYNGNMWNFTILLESGSTNSASFFCTQTTPEKDTFIASCSNDIHDYFSTNNTNISSASFTLGITGTTTALDDSGVNDFGGHTKGNFQELRLYTELLNEGILISQSFMPFGYFGNNISSSFHSLYLRLPLGSDLEAHENINSPLQNKAPNPIFHNLSGSINIPEFSEGSTFKPIVETHHLLTPDTVGSSMSSEKIRYDSGSIDGNILSPFIRSEESALDRQPLDYSTLGVFLSPTFEINEDIIYTLGGFRMDDFIGDPRHLNSGSYPDLVNLKKEYDQKISNRYNFFDYIRTIQFFDHTLFKIIEEFVPAKVNLKTGLLIEPSYLERNKFNFGDISNSSNVTLNNALYNIPPTSSGEYILYETSTNINDTLQGGGDIDNVFTFGRFSNKYYRITAPYNIPTVGTNITNPGGDTVVPDFASGESDPDIESVNDK